MARCEMRAEIWHLVIAYTTLLYVYNIFYCTLMKLQTAAYLEIEDKWIMRPGTEI